MPNEAVNSLALIFFCKQFGTRSGLSGLIGIETVWHSDDKHYNFFCSKKLTLNKNQPTTNKCVIE